MIEPFSALEVENTASCLAQKLTQIIKDLAHAPEELLALSNELRNLQMVLQDCPASRTHIPAPNPASTIDRGPEDVLFFQVQVKLDEINGLVNRWGRLNPWGDLWSMGRRDRFLWLKEKRRVIGLQAAMRELRSNIVAVIGVQTS